LEHKSPKPRQLFVESLEERTLLSVDWPSLISGLDNQLTTLDNALGGIGTVNKLPILNQPLKDVGEARQAIRTLKTALDNALAPFNDPAALPTSTDIQTALYNALYVNPAVKLLGDTNHDGTVTRDDVIISQLTDTDAVITVRLTKDFTAGAAGTANFGLGLPGIPLQVNAANNVVVKAGFDLDNLTFGVRNVSQFFLDTVNHLAGETPDRLKLTVEATIQNVQLDGRIGFMTAKVADAIDPTQKTKFHGDFTLDVTGAGFANPKLNGAADVNLMLTASFGTGVIPPSQPVFPAVNSNFHMHWDFGDANPDASASSFGNAPTVEFNQVQLELGSFLSKVLGPVVDTVQKATAPLRPVLAVLNFPLPVLSNLSNAIGQGDISLLTLARVAASTHTLPPDW
jgi:hypothetical protein